MTTQDISTNVPRDFLSFLAVDAASMPASLVRPLLAVRSCKTTATGNQVLVSGFSNLGLAAQTSRNSSNIYEWIDTLAKEYGGANGRVKNKDRIDTVLAAAVQKQDQALQVAQRFTQSLTEKLCLFYRDSQRSDRTDRIDLAVPPLADPIRQVLFEKVKALRVSSVDTALSLINFLLEVIPSISQVQIKNYPAFAAGQTFSVLDSFSVLDGYEPTLKQKVVHPSFVEDAKTLLQWHSAFDSLQRVMPQLLSVPKAFAAIRPELLLTVVVMRHGPKFHFAGEHSKLADGYAASISLAAKRLGAQLGIRRPLNPEGSGSPSQQSQFQINLSTSPVDRGVRTAQELCGQLSAGGFAPKPHVAIQQSLGTKLLPPDEAADDLYLNDWKYVQGLQKEIRSRMAPAIIEANKHLSADELEAELRAQVDAQVLSIIYGDSRTAAPRLRTSFASLAAPLNQRFRGFFNHVRQLQELRNRRKDGLRPEYVQIDVTHSFSMMAFLKENLVFEDGTPARRMDISQFLQVVGGLVGESGFFQMQYLIKGNSLTIKVSGEFTKGRPFSGTIDFGE